MTMNDPIDEIAEKVADLFAARGYAFVEEDHLEALAAVLSAFLLTAGIAVHETRPGAELTGPAAAPGHALPPSG
ncbi:hypothetical protein [Actinoplanes sp. NPDC023714]|uniref:hypothetical protein n=1 Tax=Actinoplanes sp. NPDC023714 TaxID=3154322 RepID=UPI00340BC554